MIKWGKNACLENNNRTILRSKQSSVFTEKVNINALSTDDDNKI